MTIVAFDPGDRRIGVAVSDPEERIALGRPTLARSGASWPWRAILSLIEEAGAERVVVGDPLRMDGSVGERSRISRQFAQELSERTGLPVDLQDERLTSVQAERALAETRSGARRAQGSSGRRRAGDVDRSAAVLILQAWLDSKMRRENG